MIDLQNDRASNAQLAVVGPVFSKFTIVALVFIFRILLDWSYDLVLEPHFSYLGFVSDPDLVRLLESYVLMAPVALLVPHRVQRPSHFLITLFALIPVVPMLSLYGLQGGSRAYIYAAVFAYGIVAFPYSFPLIGFPRLANGKLIALTLCIVFSLVVLIWFYIAGGLDFFSLDISKVYDFRTESHAQLSVGIFGYLNQWVFRVFNIILLAWALHKKKYVLLLAVLTLQVMYFGFSSEKKVLFAPLLVFSVYILSKLNYSTLVVVLGLTAVVAICTMTAIFFDFSLMYSFFVRRMMYVPAQLNFAYFEFFGSKGHVFLSNSLLSWLFDYPYEEIPPRMISYYLRGNTEGWANTGLLGASYMHFGFIGMFIYAAITRLLLNITDSLIVGNLPYWIGLSILIVPYFNLFTGADLTTALGTHGLGIGFLMLWLFTSQKDDEMSRFASKS